MRYINQHKWAFNLKNKIHSKWFWFKHKTKWKWRELIYPNYIFVGKYKFPLPISCDFCGEEITKAEQNDVTLTDLDELLCPYCAEEYNYGQSGFVWACDNLKGYD